MTTENPMPVDIEILIYMVARIMRNRRVYGSYANLHTVVGVLVEEYGEFKAEVFKHEDRDIDRLRAELIDIAAACIDAADQLPQLLRRADVSPDLPDTPVDQ